MAARHGVGDFVLGMDRWALRVAAYAGLMTDVYPPFRFDMGGDETGTTTIGQSPPPAPPSTGGWSAGRTAAAIIGVLLLITGAAVGSTGGFTLWADATQRDSAGYLSTSPQPFHSDGYALEFGTLELHWTKGDWTVVDQWLGDVRLKAGADEFIGIGRTDEVARHLSGVDHDKVDMADGQVTYVHRDGAPAPAPQDETLWAASGVGTVSWHPEAGSWSAVVLNVDGSRVVDTELTAQATVPGLQPLSIGLAVSGAVLALLGALLVTAAVLGARRRS